MFYCFGSLLSRKNEDAMSTSNIARIARKSSNKNCVGYSLIANANISQKRKRRRQALRAEVIKIK
jgi:hypothetical protein